MVPQILFSWVTFEFKKSFKIVLNFLYFNLLFKKKSLQDLQSGGQENFNNRICSFIVLWSYLYSISGFNQRYFFLPFKATVFCFVLFFSCQLSQRLFITDTSVPRGTAHSADQEGWPCYSIQCVVTRAEVAGKGRIGRCWLQAKLWLLGEGPFCGGCWVRQNPGLIENSTLLGSLL